MLTWVSMGITKIAPFLPIIFSPHGKDLAKINLTIVHDVIVKAEDDEGVVGVSCSIFSYIDLFI